MLALNSQIADHMMVAIELTEEGVSWFPDHRVDYDLPARTVRVHVDVIVEDKMHVQEIGIVSQSQ